MVRVGVVLSIVTALAWIGLSVVVRNTEDGAVLVLFFLPLVFVSVIVLIWAVIGLVSEIQLFRAGSGRWATERFARRP